MKKYFTHESAFIDEGAIIGNDTKIWHNVHVSSSAVIGKNCKIGQGCYVAGKIGDGCKLQNNVNVYEGVELGNFVFCGPSMTFTNDLNPRAKYPKDGKYVKTIVKEGVSFGANCTIVCGIEIGKWSFVGAGAVVTKNIPEYAIVYGTPAVLKGWICECGEKLKFEPELAQCNMCERKYKLENSIVKEIK